MRKILLFCLLFTSSFMLTSCNIQNESDSSFNEYGFDVKFLDNYHTNYNYGVMIATRNKAKYYSSSEPVVIDLFYGHEEYFDGKLVTPIEESQGIAFCFWDDSYFSAIKQSSEAPHFDDCKDIPGCFKMMDINDFYSNDYLVTIPKRGDNVFTHSEEVQIPDDLLPNINEQTKHIVLMLLNIMKKDDGKYSFVFFVCVEIVLYWQTDNSIDVVYI